MKVQTFRSPAPRGRITEPHPTDLSISFPQMKSTVIRPRTPSPSRSPSGDISNECELKQGAGGKTETGDHIHINEKHGV